MNKLLLLGGVLGLLSFGGVDLMALLQESTDAILAVMITLAMRPWLANQFD